MPKKKSARVTGHRRAKEGKQSRVVDGLIHSGPANWPGEVSRSNGTRYERPIRNPETKEQREKRLAKRAKLTLKAFRIAYENHHRS